MRYNDEIDVKTLKAYSGNARIHDDRQIEKIMNSIKEFGFIAPVVIDENNMVLVGHGRIEAAKRLGMTKVPCVYAENLTEEQKRAYVHVDNLLTERGGWDNETLQKELNKIELNMSDFGFDEETAEIDEIKEAQEKSTTITCPKCGRVFEKEGNRVNEQL